MIEILGEISRDGSRVGHIVVVSAIAAIGVGRMARQRGRNPWLFGGITAALSTLNFLLGVLAGCLILLCYPRRNTVNVAAQDNAMEPRSPAIGSSILRHHLAAAAVAIACLIVGNAFQGYVAQVHSAVGAASAGERGNSGTINPDSTQQLPRNPNFVDVAAGRGFTIEVPRNWRKLDQDMNSTIATSASAALDSVGLGSAGDRSVLLYAAVSIPSSSYASVRIKAQRPPIASPAEAVEITATDLASISRQFRNQMEKSLRAVRGNLQSWETPRSMMMAGFPSIQIGYRRSEPTSNGSVVVRMYLIFAPNDTFWLTLSYRESESTLWEPVVERIQKSARVRGEAPPPEVNMFGDPVVPGTRTHIPEPPLVLDMPLRDVGRRRAATEERDRFLQATARTGERLMAETLADLLDEGKPWKWLDREAFQGTSAAFQAAYRRWRSAEISAGNDPQVTPIELEALTRLHDIQVAIEVYRIRNGRAPSIGQMPSLPTNPFTGSPTVGLSGSATTHDGWSYDEFAGKVRIVLHRGQACAGLDVNSIERP